MNVSGCIQPETKNSALTTLLEPDEKKRKNVNTKPDTLQTKIDPK